MLSLFRETKVVADGLTVRLLDGVVQKLHRHVTVVAGFARAVGPKDSLCGGYFKGANTVSITVTSNN